MLKGLMSASKLEKKKKKQTVIRLHPKYLDVFVEWMIGLITASIMSENNCGNNIQLFIACFISVMMSYVKLSCGTKWKCPTVIRASNCSIAWDCNA